MRLKQLVVLSKQRRAEYDHETDTLSLSDSTGQVVMTFELDDALELRDLLNAAWPDGDSCERFQSMTDGDPCLAQVFLSIAQLSRRVRRSVEALKNHQGVTHQWRLWHELKRHLRGVTHNAEELATAFLPLEDIQSIVQATRPEENET